MTTTAPAARTQPLPAAGTWTIDASHSSVEFIVRHLMVAKVRGRFSEFGGTIHVGDTPEASSVEVEISPASITTGDPGRDGHLSPRTSSTSSSTRRSASAAPPSARSVTATRSTVT